MKTALDRRAVVIPVLLIAALAVSLAGTTPAAADAGSFSGNAVPKGCRSSEALAFLGTVDGKAITIRAKDVKMSSRLSSNGSFSMQGRLRDHKLGEKKQKWSGRVIGSKVEYVAEFGVPGYAETFCSARGSAQIR